MLRRASLPSARGTGSFMFPYPETIQPDVDDFRQSKWKEALFSSEPCTYSSMWRDLSTAVKEEIDANRTSEAKVLWLLANACSMILKPQSANEPFKPMFTSATARSAIPEDFSLHDVSLLAEIAPEVTNELLQARLSDLVWLLKLPRAPQYALMAIDAYLRVPLNAECLIRDGKDCWKRAIRLCKLLRSGSGDRLKFIEERLLQAIENDKEEPAGFLSLWLSELLLENGLAREKAMSVALNLSERAQRSVPTNLDQRRTFFEAALKWFKRSGSSEQVDRTAIAIAEVWVEQARERAGASGPSNMVAASFYQNSIQAFRIIPRSRRSVRVLERMAEVHGLLSRAGEASLQEMKLIESEAIDVSSLVKKAQKAVAGKTTLEALAAFANLFNVAPAKTRREQSIKALQDSPLRRLFSSTHLSKDGRVVAKRPGIDFADPTSDGYQSAVWSEMLNSYQNEIQLAVQAVIWPALQTLALEHRLKESDLVSLCSHASVVPEGRANLFGKALFFGYEGDFAASIHMLVPQIEHMVRWQLKLTGVQTTTLDQNGLETENGLSSLVSLPETSKIFGEDVTFELSALFCDSEGPNIRNELAHGLFDFADSISPFSIYAWWFGFKLSFLTFWNARAQMDAVASK